MAANIMCDLHEGDQAVFMITMIPEAETVGLCVPCGLDWAQALLQAAAPDRLAKPPARAPRTRKAKPAAAAAANGSGEQVTGNAQEKAAQGDPAAV